jgi:hypothetical protein
MNGNGNDCVFCHNPQRLNQGGIAAYTRQVCSYYDRDFEVSRGADCGDYIPASWLTLSEELKQWIGDCAPDMRISAYHRRCVPKDPTKVPCPQGFVWDERVKRCTINNQPTTTVLKSRTSMSLPMMVVILLLAGLLALSLGAKKEW